jgi:hypothetical protein
MPQDAFIQLPLKTFGSNFGGFRGSRYLYFSRPRNRTSIEDAVDEARTLMRLRRSWKAEKKILSGSSLLMLFRAPGQFVRYDRS